MARDNDDNEDLPDASHGPRECMPCRGSGKVISNLGGTASVVACPWCAGDGVRLAGMDAQAKWLADGSTAGAPAPGEPPDAAA